MNRQVHSEHGQIENLEMPAAPHSSLHSEGRRQKGSYIEAYIEVQFSESKFPRAAYPLKFGQSELDSVCVGMREDESTGE